MTDNEIYGQLDLPGEAAGAELTRYANIAEAILFAFGRAVSLNEIVKSCGCDKRLPKRQWIFCLISTKPGVRSVHQTV